MASTVFAGAAPYVNDARPGRGGLYRMSIADRVWQRVEAELPDDVQVRAIAVDEIAPSNVFIGTQYGVYESTDLGVTWAHRPFAADDEASVVWSILLADSPQGLDSNPTADISSAPGSASGALSSTLVMAGAIDCRVYCANADLSEWHSSDATPDSGLIEMGFPPRVTRLAQNPTRAAHLVAALEVAGLVGSHDGGRSWNSLNHGLLELAVEPHLQSRILSETATEGMLDSHAVTFVPGPDPAIILANRMGLFRSDDGGERWRELPVGESAPFTYARDVATITDEQAGGDTVIYAAFNTEAIGTTGGLFKSADGGARWQRLDHGVNPAHTMMCLDVTGAHNELMVFAGRGGEAYLSTDGADSWEVVELPAEAGDVYAVAFAG